MVISGPLTEGRWLYQGHKQREDGYIRVINRGKMVISGPLTEGRWLYQGH